MSAHTGVRAIPRQLFQILLFLGSGGAAFLILAAPVLAPLPSRSFQVGQVATQDILAPHTITYQSEVLTEQQRQAAAMAVPPVYTPPDPSVARQQLERLRAALAFITSVRSDAYSSSQQKIQDLEAMDSIQLKAETINSILSLNDQRWQAVQQEAIGVLEQVMRGTIRPDRLEEARRSVPTLVSLSLPEDQAAIVAELAAGFVVPNSQYSETLTEAARQSARDSVAPVTRSFIEGETVVQRGQVITQVDLEALQKLGLAQSRETWKSLLSVAVLVAVVMAFLLLYLRHMPWPSKDTRGLSMTVILFLVFLGVARLFTNEQSVIAFIVPLAAYSLTIAALFGPDPALVTSLLLAILVSYGLSDALILLLYYTLGSFFGIVALGRAQRVASFFWAGATVAGCGALITLAYHLPEPSSNLALVATLSGASILNGVASASLALLMQFFLAQFLGTTTALQLMELSRPDHPLLQLLLRNAPGTYQHSLQVANLAEQAAERIGADALLTRIGALYHDVGKALNPLFYIENQMPGSQNPHEDLKPAESAQIILRHVNDGVELARKHHIPARIQDFIREHHGTLLARYQYVNAIKEAGGDESKVDAEAFRYPGPRPQSRETAILMLADGSEARVRAESPKDETEMRELIQSVVQNRMAAGQFDDTDLTLRDLKEIVDAFTTTLRGMYHPRIEYPKLDIATMPRVDPNPTVPSRQHSPKELMDSAQSERAARATDEEI